MFFARPALAVTLTSLLFGGVTLGANELSITTAQQLIDFSNEVNSGTSYLGSTVYLGSDIDFTPSLSEQFEPIGKDETFYFNGTFDGQGHTIRNLSLNSYLGSVGLFGYSDNAIIKNVALDETCSFVGLGNSTSLSSDIGSISGYCKSCTIENVVNMGSVLFNGLGNIGIGGIAGRLIDASVIRNCVNYGPVKYSGTTNNNNVCVGGITGLCGGDETKSIRNCANYGTLTHNREPSNLYMGGIVGSSWEGSTNIENCFSNGMIVNSKQASEVNCIGSIFGYADSFNVPEVTITHCFWTSDVGYDTSVGSGSVTTTNSSLITKINATTMEELNRYTENNSTWNRWIILHLNGGKINNIDQETLVVTHKYILNPVREGYTFSFWCKENATECTEKYGPNETEVTELYAHYQMNKYTLTFIFDNGTDPEVRTLNFNESIAYPENVTREGFIFNGWSLKPETMPAHNLNVTAQWIKITEGTVEIVFEKKDMNEKEIREIIKEFTEEEFTIMKFVDDGSGETRVIVKFEDRNTAENFINKVNYSKESKRIIKRVGFIREDVISMSTLFNPNMFFGFLV